LPVTFEIQVIEDYVEAEINSTDTLVPTMTELFGDRLLRQRFSTDSDMLCDNSDLSSDFKQRLLGNGDVPGEVIDNHLKASSAVATRNGSRRYQKRALPASSSRNANTTKEVAERGGVNLRGSDHPWGPGKAVHFDDTFARTNSMMSHATFVLENDKRKPLLAGVEQFNRGGSINSIREFGWLTESILALAAFKSTPTQGNLPHGAYKVAARTNLQNVKPLADASVKCENSSYTATRKTSIGNGVPPVIPSQKITSMRPPRDSSLPRSVARPPKIIHPKSTSNELVPARAGSKSTRDRDRESEEGPNQADRKQDYMDVFGPKPRIARTPDVSHLVQ